jgi:phage tail sheath protein FI
MPETFLHGVEVIEINDGPRPIRTVRSAIIGVVGTAPDSQPEVKAKLSTGLATSNNGLTWTAKIDGDLGNAISVKLLDPKANSSALAISLSGRDIVIKLATGSTGLITTTATALKTAIEANEAVNAIVGVANTGASTGAGLVAALKRTQLSGGITETFPLNTPVLVPADQAMASKLGTTGTLPGAMDDIFDQSGALIVVVRVAEGADDDETMTNVIGGVNSTTGHYEGVHAFLGSESTNGYCPRILIAPGWTHQRPEGLANPVVADLIGVAERLRAVIIKDGPNTTDAAAITDRGDYGSKRVYVVDPFTKVRNSLGETIDRPTSARVAGLICKSDNERGFWWSPSNQNINGIVGTARNIDFVLGDANSRANLLNENEVATVIRQDGFKLWGNRTCSDDPKWAFLSVVRTADMINDSILRAHMWAVDRNITKTYLEDVTKGVNDYLSRLQGMGAILGGKCWPSVGLNTPSSIADGKVFFDFDFTPPYPAEHVTFRSKLTTDYIEEIL